MNITNVHANCCCTTFVYSFVRVSPTPSSCKSAARSTLNTQMCWIHANSCGFCQCYRFAQNSIFIVLSFLLKFGLKILLFMSCRILHLIFLDIFITHKPQKIKFQFWKKSQKCINFLMRFEKEKKKLISSPIFIFFCYFLSLKFSINDM